MEGHCWATMCDLPNSDKHSSKQCSYQLRHTQIPSARYNMASIRPALPWTSLRWMDNLDFMRQPTPCHPLLL